MDGYPRHERSAGRRGRSTGRLGDNPRFGLAKSGIKHDRFVGCSIGQLLPGRGDELVVWHERRTVRLPPDQPRSERVVARLRGDRAAAEYHSYDAAKRLF